MRRPNTILGIATFQPESRSSTLEKHGKCTMKSMKDMKE